MFPLRCGEEGSKVAFFEDLAVLPDFPGPGSHLILD